MTKFFSSIIFKGVVLHLLLFASLFAFNVLFYRVDELYLFQLSIFYLVSLIVLLYCLMKITAAADKTSKQIDNYIASNYREKMEVPGRTEINRLYDKVLLLGENIATTKDDLENQRNQLNSVLTYMVDGVIATDRRGNIELANRAAFNYLNVSEEGVIGRSLTDLLGISDKYSFYDLLEKEPEIIIDTENSDNEMIALRAKFALFRRESGFISGIVAVLHDTTDQEKAERERRLFVSNVSHELRTPLTSVKAYLEALEDGALDDKEVAASFIDVSLTETNRMMRMIRDLLTLSRMDQERVALDKELVNLIAFLNFQLNRIDQVIKQNVHGYRTKGFKIVRDLPTQPVWVEIDTDKMGQVIDNIVNNALKYSPDGGAITVAVVIKEHQVQISVTDQGIGIPKSDLPKIFDRFYRVDKARNSQVGGTGLGLSIVHDIIKMHDGSIWASSDGKNGSTFTISLPYAASPENDDNWDDNTETEDMMEEENA